MKKKKVMKKNKFEFEIKSKIENKIIFCYKYNDKMAKKQSDRHHC